MIFFFFSILKMCIHLLLKSFSIREMICPFLLLTLTNLGTVMSSAPDNVNCPCTTKITRDAQIAILADSDLQFFDNSLVQHYILITSKYENCPTKQTNRFSYHSTTPKVNCFVTGMRYLRKIPVRPSFWQMKACAHQAFTSITKQNNLQFYTCSVVTKN